MPPNPTGLALAALLLLPLGGALGQEGTGARVSTEGPRRAAPRAAEDPRSGPAAGIDDPATLLRLARSTLASGRPAETAELIERAEARLLTRSELATEADRPAMGGVVGEVAAARAALARRDSVDADARLDAAIAGLDRGDVATGAPSGPALPSAGGGAPAEVPGRPVPPRAAVAKPPPL